MENFYARRSQSRPGTTWAWVRRAGTTMAFLVAVGASVLATEARARADIHDGLVLHLSFDGDVVDHTGRGNDGTIVRPGADSPYVAGIIGRAFRTQGTVQGFDTPTGNYLTLGNPADLKFGGDTPTDFSISWWGMYTAGAQHDDIPWLSNKDWNSSNTRGWVLASEPGGKFFWNFRSRGESKRQIANNVPPLGGLDDGQWHHYVATFSRGIGGNAVIYLDGQVVDSAPINSVLDVDYPFLPTNIFQDGTGQYTDISGGANFDDASIDDLGIWRRAVTDDEVNLIYTLGQQGKSALD